MGLFHAYLPVLAFAALFRDTQALQNTDYEVVRKDVTTLLHQADRDAADFSEEARAQALFAVCAFADEALLTSAWVHRGRWARETLQRTLCGTVNAGKEFFDHCAELLHAMDRLTGTSAGMQPSSVPGKTAEKTLLDEPIELTQPIASPAGPADAARTHELANTARRPFLSLRPARPVSLPAGTSLDLAPRHVADTEADTAHPLLLWQEEALALYGAALSMGFCGQYYDPAARSRLAAIALESLEKAQRGRIAFSELSDNARRLTPEAYYMPEAAKPHRGLHLTLLAPLVLIPALATLLLYHTYNHTISLFVAEWVQEFGAGSF